MKKALTKIFNLIIILLVIYFISRFFYREWGRISFHHIEFNMVSFAVGLVLFECYVIYQILFWRKVLTSMGECLPIRIVCLFYFTSCLLAYIPGKVANILGVAQLAKSLNVSRVNTVTTVILMQIYMIISGVMLISVSWFFVDSPIQTKIPLVWIVFLWLAAISGIIAISPHFIRQTVRVLNFILKRDIKIAPMRFKIHLKYLLICSIGWFLVGLAMLFLVNSFGRQLPYTDVLNVMVIFIASYLMGLVVITLPAGLGLVELGLLYGFSILYNPTQAMIGSVSFRLVSLLTVLISYGVLYFFLGHIRNSS